MKIIFYKKKIPSTTCHFILTKHSVITSIPYIISQINNQIICHISDKKIDLSFIHELNTISFSELSEQMCRNLYVALYDKGFLQKTRRRKSKLKKIYIPIKYQDLCNFYNRMQPIQYALESPANYFIPQSGANLSRKIAKQLKISCKIYSGNELERRGFGGIYTIGNSSKSKPYLVILHYKPKRIKTRWALIGKGVTFDMGGHNIKVHSDGKMKMDKLGALTSLIILSEVVENKLPIEMWCILPFVENRIGPDAILPGSVITLYGGETLNINNTDAEGRIILADCLGWARQNCPADTILNTIATLTHYSELITQEKGALLYGNYDKIDRITNIATNMNEYSLHMPIWPMYQEMTQSEIANYQVTKNNPHNMGSMYAAAFLSNFVGDYNWIHMDISMTENPYDFVMVRPLINYFKLFKAL